MAKIIEPSFEILTPIDGEQILKHIELCGRVCYKSENLITEDSAKHFVEKIKQRDHQSVLEHFSITVKFITDRGISHEIVRHRLASFSQESSRYCVAADTSIKFKSPRVKMTIKQLYENMKNTKNGSWKRLEIAQANENTGLVDYTKIKNVFYNGEKPTLSIKTRLGYELTCTDDHEIYTPNGYIRLKDLKVGDKIYVNGKKVDRPLYQDYDWLYHQNITLNKTFKQIGEEFGFNDSTLKKWRGKLNIPKKGTGYFNVGRSPWNKGISEKDDPRMVILANALRKYHHCGHRNDKILKEDTCEYSKWKKDKCEICGKTADLEVHHLDENRMNNYESNLITVCESCHSRIHHKSLLMIYADEITDIREAGIKSVYDIEVSSNYHNYNANGIIVHNCSYNKDKFGHEITVIRPSNLNDDQYKLWKTAIEDAELMYFQLLNNGSTPEIARSVLPTCTKTELIVTANLREWKHIFEMRCSEAAHPDVRKIMIPLREEFRKQIPVIFD